MIEETAEHDTEARTLFRYFFYGGAKRILR